MPVLMSARLTAAANALSLSFFLTDLGCRSPMPAGRTLQQATMKPASSSTAKSVFAIGDVRGVPLYSA